MSAACDLSSLELRNEISKGTKRAIEIVTAQMGTMPVGTFKYKVFKYPGDIDIFEQLEGCCTFNIAKLDATQKIQAIIRDVKNSHNMMFTEFKAGYDLRYKIYTGFITNNSGPPTIGTNTTMKERGLNATGLNAIDDYNAGLIRRDINNLTEAGLFTIAESNSLLALVKDIPNIDDIMLLDERLREFWVVRWNLQEVLQGYKLLRGNYKLYLDIALSQGSIVKLDTIGYADDRYVEITNFFLITSLDKYGNMLVLTEELADYGQSLLSDVYKYYPINPLKSIKRLWMYLAFKGRICDLSIFNTLFSSNIALYSQILSDIDVAISLLLPGPRSSGNYNPGLLFDSLNIRLKALNGICTNQPLYNNVHSSDFSVIANNLKILQSCLQDQVNLMTFDWLQNKQIDIFSLIPEKPVSD